MMFNISDFLEKFKKFDQNKISQTENIIKGIESVIGLKIGKNNFDLKEGVLYVRGSAAIRQEVFLKKEHLLSVLSKEGVFDIR